MKNKRSEWLEGLLMAEKMIEEGFEYEFPTYPSLVVGIYWSKGGSLHTTITSIYRSDYLKGMYDYIEYYEEVLTKMGEAK